MDRTWGNQVKWDRQVGLQEIIRGATLEIHLGNLFRSTRLQKLIIFLVEIKDLETHLTCQAQDTTLGFSREEFSNSNLPFIKFHYKRVCRWLLKATTQPIQPPKISQGGWKYTREEGISNQLSKYTRKSNLALATSLGLMMLPNEVSSLQGSLIHHLKSKFSKKYKRNPRNKTLVPASE